MLNVRNILIMLQILNYKILKFLIILQNTQLWHNIVNSLALNYILYLVISNSFISLTNIVLFSSELFSQFSNWAKELSSTGNDYKISGTSLHIDAFCNSSALFFSTTFKVSDISLIFKPRRYNSFKTAFSKSKIKIDYKYILYSYL